jgi:hypothetical protein
LGQEKGQEKGTSLILGQEKGTGKTGKGDITDIGNIGGVDVAFQ